MFGGGKNVGNAAAAGANVYTATHPVSLTVYIIHQSVSRTAATPTHPVLHQQQSARLTQSAHSVSCANAATASCVVASAPQPQLPASLRISRQNYPRQFTHLQVAVADGLDLI